MKRRKQSHKLLPDPKTKHSPDDSSHVGGRWLSNRTAYGLVFICAAVVNLNTVWNDFVHDDVFAIIRNKDVNPDLTSWGSIWGNDFWGTPIRSGISHKSYRPLTVSTFRMNYYISGLNPWSYHVINCVLHGMISFLIVRLVDCLPTRDQLGNVGLVAGILFAVHPIHCEVVSPAVGRADLLSTLFFLLCLIMYIRSGISNLLQLTWLFILTLSSTLSKETGLMVIPVCMVYEVVVVQGGHFGNLATIFQRRETVLRLGLLVLIFGASMFVRMSITGSDLPKFSEEDNPASFAESTATRCLTYCYLFALNTWQLIAPYALSFDWQMSSIPLVTTLMDVRNGTTTAFFGMLLWLIYLCGTERGGSKLVSFCEPERKVVALACSIAILSFLPASNLFVRVGFVMADRALYIPSIGFSLLIAIGYKYFRHGGTRRRSAMASAILGLVIVLYAVKSIHRNTEWHDREIINTSSLKANPRCAKCYFNLGNMEKDLQNSNSALAYYKQAVELWPAHSPSLNNIGTILLSKGEKSEAERYFREALSADSSHASAYVNLGNLLTSKHQYEQAEQLYQLALTAKPHCAEAHANLAAIIYRKGDEVRARASYDKALKYEPTSLNIRCGYANFLMDLGQYENSSKYLLELASNEKDVEARICGIRGMGILSDIQGMETKASSWWKKYSGSRLDAVTAIFTVSKSRHITSEAKLRLYNRVLTLSPGNADATGLLAQHYAKLSGWATAQRLYESSIKASPNDAHLRLRYASDLAINGAEATAIEQCQHAERIGVVDSKFTSKLPVVYLLHAQLAAATGDKVDASVYYEKALRGSGSAGTHTHVGHFLRVNPTFEQSGNDGVIRTAQYHYRTAYELTKGAAEAATLGAFLHQKKQYKEALSFYEIAKEIDPNHPNLAKNLQKLKRAMGSQ